jgi:hypothetical protein
MKSRLAYLSSLVLLLCLVLQACAPAPTPTPVVIPPQPTNTQPAPTAIPATDTPTPLPLPTQTPEPTKIVHLTKPGDPTYIESQTIIDCILGNTTGMNTNVVIPQACDNPQLFYIERPITAEPKTYLPYLDIGQVKFGGNVDWIYAQIELYDASKPVGGGDLYYFFKLDLNFDGRNGNVILVSVKNLSQDATNWTVDGVQAWKYTDGAISPLFDQGVGADPDLIWARRSPKAIEVAFKPALLNGPSRFVWNAWSYQGSLTPNDLAYSSSPLDLYQIDNTCAWGYNASAFALINHCDKK